MIYRIRWESKEENTVNPLKQEGMNSGRLFGYSSYLRAYHDGESMEAFRCVKVSKVYFPVW